MQEPNFPLQVELHFDWAGLLFGLANTALIAIGILINLGTLVARSVYRHRNKAEAILRLKPFFRCGLILLLVGLIGVVCGALLRDRGANTIAIRDFLDVLSPYYFISWMLFAILFISIWRRMIQ